MQVFLVFYIAGEGRVSLRGVAAAPIRFWRHRWSAKSWRSHSESRWAEYEQISSRSSAESSHSWVPQFCLRLVFNLVVRGTAAAQEKQCLRAGDWSRRVACKENGGGGGLTFGNCGGSPSGTVVVEVGARGRPVLVGHAQHPQDLRKHISNGFVATELGTGWRKRPALTPGSPPPTSTAATDTAAAKQHPTLAMLRYLVQRRDSHCGEPGNEVSTLAVPHLNFGRSRASSTIERG